MKLKYLPLVIILLALLFRIPSFFEPYWYGDEGIRLTVAQNWLSGRVLYRDIYDNAPPLLYLLFAAGRTLPGVKILAAIWVLTATFAFWLLAQLLTKNIGKKHALFYSTVATSLFVLFTSTPIFEGNIANGEIFFILPTILAMYLILEKHQEKDSQIFFLLAGSLFAFATLIKIPAVTDFLAAFIFLLIFLRYTPANVKRKVLPFLGGFIIPWGITLLIFYSLGNFSYFYHAVFGYNFSYVNFTNRFPVLQGLLLTKIFFVALLSLLIFRIKEILKTERSFILLWLIFSFLGALLSGRNYPHYLIQTAAPLSLTLPLFLLLPSLLNITVSLLFGAFLVALFSLGHFPRQRVLSYYQNFLTYILKWKDETMYLRWFDQKTPRLYNLAGLVQAKTKPGECVFVYGDEPNFYPLAQRCPATFVTVAYHLEFAPQFKAWVINQLAASPPRYIITIKNTSTPFEELFLFLKTHYQNWSTLEDAIIWQKVN